MYCEEYCRLLQASRVHHWTTTQFTEEQGGVPEGYDFGYHFHVGEQIHIDSDHISAEVDYIQICYTDEDGMLRIHALVDAQSGDVFSPSASYPEPGGNLLNDDAREWLFARCHYLRPYL